MDDDDLTPPEDDDDLTPPEDDDADLTLEAMAALIPPPEVVPRNTRAPAKRPDRRMATPAFDKDTAGQISHKDSLRTMKQSRQDYVIKTVAEGGTRIGALRKLNIDPSTEKSWRRERGSDYLMRIKAAQTEAALLKKRPTSGENSHNPAALGFVQFRLDFFDRATAPHHLLMIETIERAKPGEIAMILAFPGAAKTSCLVDYVNYKLAMDANMRFAYISEGQSLARKTLGQIADRMSDDKRFRKYISTYGPFRTPVNDGPKKYQGREGANPWTADYIKVHKSTHDEKDFSVEALGAGSRIYGGRFDRMIYDDLQSTQNLSATEKILGWLRQDALTRPGHEDGGHIIIGSRVGKGDLYETMLSEEMVAKFVRIPALSQWVDRDDMYTFINGKIVVNPTCPATPTWDYWTLHTLAQRRHLVKEEIWSRTYMQQDFHSHDSTFTEQMLDKAKDTSLRAGEPFGTEVIATLDPALQRGKCAFMILGGTQDALAVIDVHVKTGFNTYDDIYTHINSLSARYRPSVWVVEANNFQQGLIDDQRFIALGNKYGFKIQAHKTHRNKHDPVTGVAMMASAFTDGEVKIPWSGVVERERFGPLLDELREWTPTKRGSQLKMDQVMALWFGWRYWQNIREVRWASRVVRRDIPSWMRNKTRGIA